MSNYCYGILSHANILFKNFGNGGYIPTVDPRLNTLIQRTLSTEHSN